MMYKLILAICIAISGNSFAAKSYTLTIKVFSLSTQSPLEGFKIFTVINDEKLEVGLTNTEGEIVIKELSEKSLNIIAEDPENMHRQGIVYVYNKKRTDQTEEMHLRLNRVHEDNYFSSIDLKYENDSSLIVNQIPSGKSSISEEDSIDFIPASPKGGASEFYRFISMNIEYPHDCYEKNIQGKIYISFIVQKDGAITNVVVMKGVNKSLDDEAVRVIRYAPKWNPALSDGKPIKAMVRTPVSFILN